MVQYFLLIALSCSMICICLICSLKRKNNIDTTPYRPLHMNSNSSCSSQLESSTSESCNENSVHKVRFTSSRPKMKESAKANKAKIKRNHLQKVSHFEKTNEKVPAHSITNKTNTTGISKDCCHHFAHHHDHYIHHLKPDYLECAQLSDILSQLVAKEQNLKQSSTLFEAQSAYTRHFCGRCYRLLNAILSTFVPEKSNYESFAICRFCGQRSLDIFKIQESERNCYADCRKKFRNHRCSCYLARKFENEFCSFCSTSEKRTPKSAKFFNNCFIYCSRHKLNHCLTEVAKERKDTQKEENEDEDESSKKKVSSDSRKKVKKEPRHKHMRENIGNAMTPAKNHNNYHFDNLRRNSLNQTNLVSDKSDSMETDVMINNSGKSLSEINRDENVKLEDENLEV